MRGAVAEATRIVTINTDFFMHSTGSQIENLGTGGMYIKIKVRYWKRANPTYRINDYPL